ncbi:MAG: hypothetical protein ACE5EG_03025 [Thermoanaerobaculia bacterium]
MSSEYDPVFGRHAETPGTGDLESVQTAFERAAGPYLASPVPWLVWGLALPGAALATRRVLATGGARAVLLVWSLTILTAGAVEAAVYARRRSQRPQRSTLARWALRSQGNLSLAAVILSLALLAAGEGRLLPTVWLLLLGHSLYGLGGLASPPLKRCGLIYQLGGLASLPLIASSDLVFALTTFVGNLSVAFSIWRQR